MESGFVHSRRGFLAASAMTVAESLFPFPPLLEAEHKRELSLFDQKSLKGWLDSENSATSFSGNDLLDLQALARSITAKSNATAAYLNAALDDSVRSQLSRSLPPDSPEAKVARS